MMNEASLERLIFSLFTLLISSHRMGCFIQKTFLITEGSICNLHDAATSLYISEKKENPKGITKYACQNKQYAQIGGTRK
jgi:hypothetical protein